MIAKKLRLLARPLHDEQKFWVPATVLFCFMSVLKGFRAPSLWAATQAQFDYSQGLVKRGLFGATITRFLQLNHYRRFAVASTILLFLFIVLIFLFGQSSRLGERLGSAQPLAVFAASYAIVFLVHLNGYLDIVLGLLTVCVLLIRDVNLRFLFAIPAVFLGLLFHELFLFVFFPVILLSFILDAWAEQIPSKRKYIICGVIALTFLALGLTVRLALKAPLLPVATTKLLSYQQRHTDFSLQRGVFDVLNLSTAGNLRIMFKMARTGYWWKQQLTGFLLYLPFAVYMLFLMFRLISAHQGSGKTGIFASCLAASICPLVMNLLGWDIGRWYALTGLTIFLVLCTLCRGLPGTSLQMTSAVQRAGWMVIILGMASGGMMMDNRIVTPYPFVTTGLAHAWSVSDGGQLQPAR